MHPGGTTHLLRIFVRTVDQRNDTSGELLFAPRSRLVARDLFEISVDRDGRDLVAQMSIVYAASLAPYAASRAKPRLSRVRNL